MQEEPAGVRGRQRQRGTQRARDQLATDGPARARADRRLVAQRERRDERFGLTCAEARCCSVAQADLRIPALGGVHPGVVLEREARTTGQPVMRSRRGRQRELETKPLAELCGHLGAREPGQQQGERLVPRRTRTDGKTEGTDLQGLRGD
jgi:hypothetical protein